MEEVKISASIRDRIGSKKIRKLRNEGFIPAIIYGKEVTPVAISIHRRELKEIMKHRTTLISIELKQDDKVNNYDVIIKDIQYNPLTDDVIHIDFQHVVLDKPLVTRVPIEFIGTPIGEKEGGLVEEVLREIEVECLPKDVPPKIELDIAGLKIGETLYVREIKLEDKIKILTPPDERIVSILPPRKIEEVIVPPEVIEERKEPEVIREKKEED